MDFDITATVVVTLALLWFLAIVMGLGVRYGQLADRYGKLAARRLFPREVVEAVLLIVVVIVLWMAQDKRDVIRALIFLLAIFGPWVALLALAILRISVGKTLLDLGIPDKASYWAVAFWVLYSAMQLLDSTFENELGIEDIAWILFVVSFAMVRFFRNRMKTLATEKGIYTNSYCIKWKQIECYEWEESAEGRDILLIEVKGWLPLFSTRVLLVPSDYKDDMSSLLAQYATALELSPGLVDR